MDEQNEIIRIIRELETALQREREKHQNALDQQRQQFEKEINELKQQISRQQQQIASQTDQSTLNSDQSGNQPAEVKDVKVLTREKNYDPHNRAGNGFVYSCNKCKKFIVDVRYHCFECDDFDLCTSCYNIESHPHKMEQLKFSAGIWSFVDDDSVGNMDSSNDTTSPAEYRHPATQRSKQSFMHARESINANYADWICQRMKRLISHAKSCKINKQHFKNCSMCRQLVALCRYHAKHWEKAMFQERIGQNQILMRRIDTMSARSVSLSANSIESNSHQQQAGHEPAEVLDEAGRSDSNST